MKIFSVPLLACAILFVLLGVPAFFSKEYAEAAVLLSNLVYALPILVSYFANMFDFVSVILICAIFSLFYHSCKSYDFCFHLGEKAWESIDVAYSWYLLLTLVSFFALGKRFSPCCAPCTLRSSRGGPTHTAKTTTIAGHTKAS